MFTMADQKPFTAPSIGYERIKSWRAALTPSPSPWGEGSKIQSPSPQGEGFRVRAGIIA
jgi:hypothetical protein